MRLSSSYCEGRLFRSVSTNVHIFIPEIMAGTSKSKSSTSNGAAGSKRHQKQKKDPITGITNPAVRRLARRGGVKRIREDAYGQVRRATQQYLEKIIGDSIVYCTATGRKTVSAEDVVAALRRSGTALYGYGAAL